MQSFEDALIDIPEITRAERLFGEPDYMLHVVTRDLLSTTRHVIRTNWKSSTE
ncbi:Lrp/AsnC ligand binding domain-containing protein [Paraburkholderia sp. EG287B]|uniref:Lrp/AsnC ligand binding domain-containing protein n=1 Tax=unclassified Paraburkholderia TaxID=2615204 RepID=UPI0034D28F43